MLRRAMLGLSLAVGLALVAVALAAAMGYRPLVALEVLLTTSRPPIVVGLLHSRTGPLAISEKSIQDAEILALEEINAAGGVAGRQVRWVEADGRSDAATFASEARRLIEREGAVALFGTWTAESRRAVREVVEERGSLLVYPGTFEGMERAARVLYAGGSSNQTIVPGVRYCVDGLKARKFFVIGTEEIWSRCSAEIAKDVARASGAEVVGEAYLPLSGGDVEGAIAAIKASSPDLVLNAITGDSNQAFYSGYRRAGLTADRMPILALGLAEDELRMFRPADSAGHYSVMNYFQSLDRPENREFVRRFRARFGDDRATSDPIVAAHNGVKLWARTADELGTVEAGVVIEHIGRQSLDAPEGVITVDAATRIFWRPAFVGRARADGQFDIAWANFKPIFPRPYVSTRTKYQWDAFIEGLRSRWGGRWSGSSTTEGGTRAPAKADPGPKTDGQ